ncbi:ADP-ribosylglycohydrolase family protein [Roseomonas xinghualingensis]|uniref:ADP-ribosylglycohydrolase family protein n=1 Tax=Roseomonas xinghualingensis TaxID=2986475 RepID=UPI0021F118B7|nr:ADP-ribosylglycohydrolase family protein [Roseomonas sp. SXEYE001]MCV4210349.1 ADP-ribosylglycohydrolase family protein [Roseomonas sp. SXEYE001]
MAEDILLSAEGPEALAEVQASAAALLGDRARGALVGLAVGDALGTTLEFSERDEHPHHAEMTGGGPFRLKPGQWTDDTSMALALADSLIAHPDFDARDLMDRFVSWWREGAYSCTGTCFDIGMATRDALARYLKSGNPFAGSTDPYSAGNGSLMRLAPAAIHALHDPAFAQHLAVQQSRTTHAAPQAVEACSFFAELLMEAMQGVPKAELLEPRGWKGDPAIVAAAKGTWRGRDRSAVRSSGYVVHTLEAALWAVERTESFEEALVLAVNLGDDADSVGAVTGQLAGALYGMSGIPARWLEPLAWQARLVGLADALLAGEMRK